MDSLIETLTRKQRELAEPDGIFANRFGMTRQHWLMLRRKRARPGRVTLERILRAFPEFQLQVMASLFLPSDSKIVEIESTNEVAV